MARMRSLRPDYYLREDMADVSLEAHFLLGGLQVLADREGRLLDRPRTIKAQVFPFREVDIESALLELIRARVVARYEVDGRRIIALLTWEDDQTPHPKETSAGLPPPPIQQQRSITPESYGSGKVAYASRRDPLGVGIGCGSRDGCGSRPTDVSVAAVASSASQGTLLELQADTPPPLPEKPKRAPSTTAMGEFIDWARGETRPHLPPDAVDPAAGLKPHERVRLGEAVKAHGLEACKAAFRMFCGWDVARSKGYSVGFFANQWEQWVRQAKAPGRGLPANNPGRGGIETGCAGCGAEGECAAAGDGVLLGYACGCMGAWMKTGLPYTDAAEWARNRRAGRVA